MSTIHFFGKTNCVNNIKQKKLLLLAEHEIIEHDILKEAWTKERLQKFFIDVPFEDWFNKSAPAIKNMTIKPNTLTPDQAIDAMIKDPYLIKRPLIIVDETYLCGFTSTIISMLTINTSEEHKKHINEILKENITTCSQINQNTNCDTK